MPRKTSSGKPADCDSVLLHACCAPCSSAIVEWLVAHGVRPTVFYYNPNIWPREEYVIRKEESQRHAAALGLQWIDGDYDHASWRQSVCGLEGEPERGRRCEQCFLLRLTETARRAAALGIRYFATTLASSRWKSLEQVNRAGLLAEQIVRTETGGDTPVFWAQNWRKGGLQERRNQLLREYGFYNQQYCGCEFSARQRAGSLSVDAALTKPLLRQQMRDAKRQHQGQLPALSAQIVDRLTARLLNPSISYSLNFSISQSLTVLSYWPLPDEVDVRPLNLRLAAEGHTVLLPCVTGPDSMELRRFTSPADLAKGAFHIQEPTGERFPDLSRIDVVLMPGMAFDAAGHRLGRGRGYYDRFLAALRPAGYSDADSVHRPSSSLRHPLLIGVCFPFQRVPLVPSEPHDVLMDEVL